MKTNLFIITIGVRPTPEHSDFGKFQDALFNLYLFADSGADAAQKARTIISQLPYERIGGGVLVTSGNVADIYPLDDAAKEAHKDSVRLACSAGLGFYLARNTSAKNDGWIEDNLADEKARFPSQTDLLP